MNFFKKKKETLYQGANFINGKWEGRLNDFQSINPATQKPIGQFPIALEKEVNRAVTSARNASHRWKRMSRVKRGEILDNLAQLIKKNHEKLVEVISLETGKSVNESHAEVMETLHMVQYAAASARMPYGEMIASEIGEKDAYILRKPKGVVAIVSPWNFPVAIGGAWNAAPALVEGNTVVWKPSELTPMCAQAMVELYNEAGIPPGVFNLIHGIDRTGELLVQNKVDCILFTGSAEVGRLIRQHCATTWNKTCACEMGSKSGVIVFDDANLNLAIDACVASAFKLSGQRCVSAGRLLVQRNILDQFTKEFVARVQKLKIGDPFSMQDAFYGPMISEEQRARVLKYNNLTKNDPDTEVLLEGKSFGEGYFLTPHVYRTEWRNNAPYLKEEVFGPHCAIIPFNNTYDAIEIFNDTDYGLAVGVITDDFRRARKCRDELDVGMCYWNGGSIAAESHSSFGGVKKSGNGWPSAARTYQAVTHEMTWTVNHEEGITFCQGMNTK